jgi:alkanesulfonate monooxygenase SsuD/methylene tetrahydromethanopterin reductase-like flavin-dependent oxidoreductase (luciferase family)
VLPDKLSGVAPSETIRLAEAAERAGFHSVWKGESNESNAFELLSVISSKTDTVRLGTGIANVYSRSPTLLAMSANTLNDLSDGRTILGLGVSSKPIVEEWHGLEFDHQLRRLRETIEIIDKAFESDTLEYDGHLFDPGPYSSNYLSPENRPSMFNAAMGPTNRKLTGEFADGWIPLFVPRQKLDAYADEMRSDREQNSDLTVAPWIPTAVDADPDRAERRVRAHLAQELGMGYNRVFRQYGYGDSVDEVTETWREGDREAAMAAISEEILSDFTIHGTPDSCREQLTRYVDSGADLPIVWPSFEATVDDVETLVRELGAWS